MEFVAGMIFASILNFLLFRWIVKEMKEDCDYWYENSRRWMEHYFDRENT